MEAEQLTRSLLCAILQIHFISLSSPQNSSQEPQETRSSFWKSAPVCFQNLQDILRVMKAHTWVCSSAWSGGAQWRLPPSPVYNPPQKTRCIMTPKSLELVDLDSYENVLSPMNTHNVLLHKHSYNSFFYRYRMAALNALVLRINTDFQIQMVSKIVEL